MSILPKETCQSFLEIQILVIFHSSSAEADFKPVHPFCLLLSN